MGTFNSPSYQYDPIPSTNYDENGNNEEVVEDHPGNKIFRRNMGVLGVVLFGALLIVVGNQNTNTPAMNDSSFPLLGLGDDNDFCHGAEECTPKWFETEVDHFDPLNKDTYFMRYFTGSKYFGGPGNPIFFIVGGEDELDEILYPFINERLASKFHAYVVNPEHRFYGESQPLPKIDEEHYDRNPELLKKYLEPEQAIADNLALIRYIQNQLGCSYNKQSKDYCPVITVGASYPGFLSAMMRFLHPDFVDMSYASSAPLKLYAQDVSPHEYYDHLTDVTEGGSPGCAYAFKTSLLDARDELRTKPFNQHVVESLGICWDTVPDYIDNIDLFTTEMLQIISTSNADFNMDYYPPQNPDSALMKQCKSFQNIQHTPLQRVRDFFLNVLDHPDRDCYDMEDSLADGPFARITGADWSGMGPGDNGLVWEFQCCKDLIIQTGFYEESMFPTRPFDLDWITEHCQRRFQVTPTPTRLVEKWHFDDLLGHGASKILFTNGELDGWFLSSITQDLSDDVLALNFPNGTHHSDLRGAHYNSWPLDNDTDDITRGYDEIEQILGEWLAEFK